jgi:hypothetical protein
LVHNLLDLDKKMNEYWLYFFFFLTNIPMYLIIFQLIRDRQILQHEIFLLYNQCLQERTERRYSDMEEGNSEADELDINLEHDAENDEKDAKVEQNVDEKQKFD